MSAIRYPQRIQAVHVESIDGELCVYDTARQHVHALNHTAAFVWQRCDGRTAFAELAAALSAETSVDNAEALVRLTLKELSAAQLLAAPIDGVAAVSRRDLLRRGVAAAAIPAIYSIVAPFPVEAQSPAPPGTPTLTSVSPNQGTAGTTVPVTLTGTNFVVGATTVIVNSGGVTATNVIVSSTTSLTANIVIDPAAVLGAHSVTVMTAGGTSGAQTFTVNPPPSVPPTLTSVSPNEGIQGATVAVTLTGTNFVVAATTVNVSGAGVTVNNVVVGDTTSLTASFVLDPAAATGARTVTVTTAGGTSGAQTFTINLPPPATPTLTSVSPNEGLRGTTVAVTLTGTNFIVGATTVNVAGGGVTVTNVIVGSNTSLTANFMLDLAADGPRTVTVTTAGGTSGGQTFTINLPAPGTTTFNFTGSPEIFTVPAGVVRITILATGAQGGFGGFGGVGGLGGRTTATVSVTPGASLTVRVGRIGLTGSPESATAGVFFGGGGSAGDGGGGGGASSVHDGATALVIAGGGGGGGAEAGGGATVGGGNGGAGGGLIPDLTADPGGSPAGGGGGGGGGTQTAGGAGGARSTLSGTDGTIGAALQGGTGGSHQPGVIGGGGGGGGYFGGGGGGGGNPGTAGAGGGGGGSSFAALGATSVVYDKGVKAANGFVTISW